MYFVTIREKNGRCILGGVAGNQVYLSPVGEIIQDCWEELPLFFGNVETNDYVVMPNHFHGIITIVTQVYDDHKKERSGKGFIHETQPSEGLINQTHTRRGRPLSPQMADAKLTLGKIIRAY